MKTCSLFTVTITLILTSCVWSQTATKMYWTDNGTNKVQRSNLNGTYVEDLVGALSWPSGIAVDFINVPNKVYWTDLSTLKIQRSNIDGSGIEDLVTSGLGSPSWIALDLKSNKMYWTDLLNDKIQRSNLDGTVVEDLVTGLSTPQGIAINVADGKMYWVDNGTVKIQRANLDGSGLEDLISLAWGSNPFGIALDVSAGKMYWAEQGSHKIKRANLDGTAVEDVIASGISSPYGIAIDATAGKVYWSDYGSQKIQRANTSGTGMEDVIIGLGDVYDVCLDYVSGSVDVSLPVELTSFYASMDRNAVALHWSTASELNNLGYNIFRSTSENGDYEKLTDSLIPGAGNSACENVYNFVDNSCIEGNTYWYQLEDISFSGERKIHGPVKITVMFPETSIKFELAQNFPNPFNPETRIDFEVPRQAWVTLKIYDVLGKTVATLVDKTMKKGKYSFLFNGRNLSSGDYVYRIAMGGFSTSKKMTLLR